MSIIISGLVQLFRPDGGDIDLDLKATGVIHSELAVHQRNGMTELRGSIHFNEGRDPDGDTWRFYATSAELIARTQGCKFDYASIAYKEKKLSSSTGATSKSTKRIHTNQKGGEVAGSAGASISEGFNIGAEAKAMYQRKSEIQQTEETQFHPYSEKLISVHILPNAEEVRWSIRPDNADTKQCATGPQSVLHGEWLTDADEGVLGKMVATEDKASVRIDLKINRIALSKWHLSPHEARIGRDPRIVFSERALEKALTGEIELAVLICEEELAGD